MVLHTVVCMATNDTGALATKPASSAAETSDSTAKPTPLAAPMAVGPRTFQVVDVSHRHKI